MSDPRPRSLWRFLRYVLIGPPVFLAWLWAILALYYANMPGGHALRAGVAALFAVGTVVAARKWRCRGVLAGGVVWCGILVWFVITPARNDRDWREDLAVPPRAEFSGDLVTIHGFRNFEYRSETDVTPRREDRTFDLRKTRQVDFVVSYFGDLEAMAHTMLSFGFSDDRWLVFSVEARVTRGEAWSPLAGLFKRYELFYVLGDERDLIRARTNFRGEDVYVFRSRMTPEESATLLRHVLDRANRLAREPVWYSTIGQNCTTTLVDHVNAIWPGSIPYSKKILLNGYSPRIGFENGTFDTDLSYEEYRRAHRVTDVAKRTPATPEFSKLIRKDLPSQ